MTRTEIDPQELEALSYLPLIIFFVAAVILIGALLWVRYEDALRKPLDKSGHPKAGIVKTHKRRGKL